MKKLLVLSAAVALTVAVNAQSDVAAATIEKPAFKHEASVNNKEKKEVKKKLRKLEGKEVSYQSKNEFNVDFGNIPVSKWERIENFDKATFTKDGKEISAYYDYDAKLVGTTMHKTFADLPATSQKTINEKYPGYSKVDVVLFDDNEVNETDMVLYGTQFDDVDSYFVELKKDNKTIILQVSMSGAVSFYEQLK